MEHLQYNWQEENVKNFLNHANLSVQTNILLTYNTLAIQAKILWTHDTDIWLTPPALKFEPHHSWESADLSNYRQKKETNTRFIFFPKQFFGKEKL